MCVKVAVVAGSAGTVAPSFFALSASFVPSENMFAKGSFCLACSSRHAMLTYAAACAARSQRQSDLGLPSDAPPVLPVDTLAAAQPRAIIHRADRMQGIGIST